MPWKWRKPVSVTIIRQIPLAATLGFEALGIAELIQMRGDKVNFRIQDLVALPLGIPTLAHRAFGWSLACSDLGFFFKSTFSLRLWRLGMQHGANWDTLIEYPEITCMDVKRSIELTIAARKAASAPRRAP